MHADLSVLRVLRAVRQSTLIKQWHNTPNLDEEALAFFLDFVKTHEMLRLILYLQIIFLHIFICVSFVLCSLSLSLFQMTPGLLLQI